MSQDPPDQHDPQYLGAVDPQTGLSLEILGALRQLTPSSADQVLQDTIQRAQAEVHAALGVPERQLVGGTGVVVSDQTWAMRNGAHQPAPAAGDADRYRVLGAGGGRRIEDTDLRAILRCGLLDQDDTAAVVVARRVWVALGLALRLRNDRLPRTNNHKPTDSARPAWIWRDDAEANRVWVAWGDWDAACFPARFEYAEVSLDARKERAAVAAYEAARDLGLAPPEAAFDTRAAAVSYGGPDDVAMLLEGGAGCVRQVLPPRANGGTERLERLDEQVNRALRPGSGGAGGRPSEQGGAGAAGVVVVETTGE